MEEFDISKAEVLSELGQVVPLVSENVSRIIQTDCKIDDLQQDLDLAINELEINSIWWKLRRLQEQRESCEASLSGEERAELYRLTTPIATNE